MLTPWERADSIAPSIWALLSSHARGVWFKTPAPALISFTPSSLFRLQLFHQGQLELVQSLVAPYGNALWLVQTLDVLRKHVKLLSGVPLRFKHRW